MKRAGIWLTWTGGIIMVACLGAAIAFGVAAFDFGDGANDGPIPVSGPGNTVDIYFDEDQQMQLWVHGPDSFVSRPTPECVITGPMDVEPADYGQGTVTVFGETRESFASFRVVESGVYTVTCDQDNVSVAPPLPLIESIIDGLKVMAAIGGAAVGFALLVPGIILWLLGGRRKGDTMATPQ